MSLSACSAQVVATPKASVDPQIAAAAKKTAAAAKKTTACVRVVAIKSDLAAIHAQIFQMMSVGNESGIWGPIVMDLDRQKVVLNTEMTAKKRICDGPVASKTVAPSARVSAASGRPVPKEVSPVQVARLTWKIDRDPKDKDSYRELADLYFFADDFENAAVWEQKLLDFAPEDEASLMALGASQYNLEHFTEAEKQWRVAEWLYADDLEVHYSLGCLYRDQTPPDTVKMMMEWKIIMLLGPGSDFGKLVAPQMT
jgi:tetratricopeptide (TPR) repeat protein